MSEQTPLNDAELSRLMQGIAPLAGRQLDSELTRFAQAWLFNGAYLQCRACGLSQLASQASRPFNHLPDCSSAAGLDVHPWQALSSLLTA